MGNENKAAPLTPKAAVKALLDELPDDATFEEIQYHLYVRELVERRLELADHTPPVSMDDAKGRMARWLDE